MDELTRWTVTVTVPPTVEPVTVDDAKLFLREDTTSQDAVIARMITSARKAQEKQLGVCMNTQTLVLSLSTLGAFIRIPRTPVQSITSITYVDIDGVTQTLYDSSHTTEVDINLSERPAIIRPSYLTIWPYTRCVENAVQVTFVAGYGDAKTDVPEDLVDALLMRIADRYENREGKSSELLNENKSIADLEENYRLSWTY